MTLHIVTGADDNYAPGVLVLIASAAWHNPGARFTVLDMGISDANRGRIDALGAALGLRVARIVIDETRLAALPVVRAHLTRSTFLRLLIPDLMPAEHRVVYMDCDMAVTGSLQPLAALDLGNHPVAAVPDPSPDARELAATGTGLGGYVNAGLLVMNLPVWRREDVAGQCIALLSDPARPLRAEDQSAVNIACRDRILPLPAEFNVFTDPPAGAAAAPARARGGSAEIGGGLGRAMPAGGLERIGAERYRPSARRRLAPGGKASRGNSQDGRPARPGCGRRPPTRRRRRPRRGRGRRSRTARRHRPRSRPGRSCAGNAP